MSRGVGEYFKKLLNLKLQNVKMEISRKSLRIQETEMESPGRSESWRCNKGPSFRNEIWGCDPEWDIQWKASKEYILSFSPQKMSMGHFLWNIVCGDLKRKHQAVLCIMKVRGNNCFFKGICKTGCMGQVVEYLPSMGKLSSNACTTKRKMKRLNLLPTMIK